MSADATRGFTFKHLNRCNGSRIVKRSVLSVCIFLLTPSAMWHSVIVHYSKYCICVKGGYWERPSFPQSSHLFMFPCLYFLRTLHSKKQQSGSLSLSQVATPRKTLSFSAVSTPVNHSSSVVQESNAASDASLLTSIFDQSNLRQRTVTTTTTATSATSVDGHWGQL